MCLDTKKILAQKFMELCDTKNIRNITVHDVVSYCGVCKRTFYNYFHDLNEVVEWIFASHFKDPVGVFSDFDAWSFETAKIFNDNWKFYKKVIMSTDFIKWYENWLYDNMRQFIRIHYGNKKVTAETEICLKVWIAGICRSLPELINNFKHISPGYFFMMYRENMPGKLYEFFPVYETDSGSKALVC